MITPEAVAGGSGGLSTESVPQRAVAPRLSIAPIICLDGGAGTGKSTIATCLAQRLGGLAVVDTGLWFRGLAVLAERHGINIEDEQRVAAIVKHVTIVPPTGSGDGPMHVIYNDGTRRSEYFLRASDLLSEEVGERASKLGRQPAVRDSLLDSQRKLALESGCVTTGRAQGTEVFGQSFEAASTRPVVRILLWAAPEVRAQRRFVQQFHRLPRGPQELAETLEFIKSRDERDITRKLAPLLTKEQATDAGYVVVDTGNKSIPETVDAVVAALGARLVG